MNNLLFEKIWEDADFYQIMVKALAKNIIAETKVYVTKENIARLTNLGVDYVSSGALTHSAPILDLSLKNLHVL